MTHTVRLRAYAISSCLRLLSPSPFLTLLLSLYLCSKHPPMNFPSDVPSDVPSPLPPPPHPFSYSPLFTIFLSGSARVAESRNRGRSSRELPDGCPRWSNGTLAACISQRAVRLSRGLIKNNFSYLYRDTSFLVRALYLTRPLWLLMLTVRAHVITRIFSISLPLPPSSHALHR